MTITPTLNRTSGSWAHDDHSRATSIPMTTRARRSYAERSAARFQLLLSTFWAVFWSMNGLDKVFNAPKFFGITRDASFVEYFARIGLPEWVATAALRGICAYEVALGALFFVVVYGRSRLTAFDPARLNLIALELSLALFAFFALGDILFGGRAELWEHSTYIALIAISYVIAYRFTPQLDDPGTGGAR